MDGNGQGRHDMAQDINSVCGVCCFLWHGSGQLADAVTAKAEFQEAGSPVKGTVTFSQVRVMHPHRTSLGAYMTRIGVT